MVGGDFGAGFVDVVNVEGRVEEENGGARFGAGALGLVDVLGGQIAEIAVGEKNGLFTLHGNFEQAGERNGAFARGVPVPGDDAARSEFHFDYGGTFGWITFEDGESEAVWDAGNSGEFCGHAFGDDGKVGGFLGGRGQNGEKKCGEKNCFHAWLRLVSEYVRRFRRRVSMEIAGAKSVSQLQEGDS